MQLPSMNKRFKLLLGAVFLVLVVGFVSITSLPSEITSKNPFANVSWPSYPKFEATSPVIKAPEVVQNKTDPQWEPSSVLRGAPSMFAKDNLLHDRHYITCWSIAGFTNQFMSYVNLIYLGVLSDRVPILPPFVPSHHLATGAVSFPFGEVFNISALRNTLRRPILEWRDVKDLPTATLSKPNKEDLEQIGCWSTRKPGVNVPVKAELVINHLRLDPAYTRVPGETRTNISDPNDDFVVLNNIAPYVFPTKPLASHEALLAPASNGQRLEPDKQLACFDILYFASTSHRQFEWEQVWSPMWRFVGTHIQFTDSLRELTKAYVARAFKTEVADIPLFIAIHMRRTDFADPCGDKPEECLRSFPAFQEKVDVIKKDLLVQHNKQVDKVLLFSDDETPSFWDEVSSLGWNYLDHKAEMTVTKHGEWYPTIIDVAAQSMAIGFVGTASSTFSLLSVRRVTDWQNGSTALVQRQR